MPEKGHSHRESGPQPQAQIGMVSPWQEAIAPCRGCDGSDAGIRIPQRPTAKGEAEGKQCCAYLMTLIQILPVPERPRANVVGGHVAPAQRVASAGRNPRL